MALESRIRGDGGHEHLLVSPAATLSLPPAVGNAGIGAGDGADVTRETKRPSGCRDGRGRPCRMRTGPRCARLSPSPSSRTAPTYCTGIRILTTSRDRLNVEGELVWVALPFAVPPGGTDAATAGEYSSVQLFVDRALARWPTQEVTESTSGALVWLCRHLESMLPAIELAQTLPRRCGHSHLRRTVRSCCSRLPSARRCSTLLRPRRAHRC